MRFYKSYIKFCQKFQKLFFPKLKFKLINEHYKNLYRNLYDLDEEDINKATFFVCLLSFCVFVAISEVFTNLNILIISLYSLIFSLIFSYKFNLVVYYDIKKNEAEINAILHVIKIDFSLIQKTLKPNSDYYLSFIKLIIEYDVPFFRNFKNILNNIHEGKKPEDQIKELITPSKDFNLYLKTLLINNFSYNYTSDKFKDNSSENNFRIYLKEIQSKISVIFFIGVFFPLGLCFLILFQVINIILLLLIVPFFFYILNFLFRKFLERNTYMIGVLNDYSDIEKKKFNEFLFFLKSFASNLKNNISPERAFQRTYSENKNLFIILDLPIKNQLSRLLNINCSFNDIIYFFKQELNSVRYNVILDAVERFTGDNPYYSTKKINDLLKILQRHQKLEKELELIIKGEKFKIFFFIYLLPILIGSISGLIPFFLLITKNINLTNPSNLFDFNNLINTFYFIILYLIFAFNISITSNYFLKIIKFRKKFLVILLSNLIFLLTFLISFFNIINIL
jgi:hypothetical protein